MRMERSSIFRIRVFWRKDRATIRRKYCASSRTGLQKLALIDWGKEHFYEVLGQAERQGRAVTD
jgi:hypothetical protein